MYNRKQLLWSRGRRRNRSGLTLVEVVIAIGLIAITMTAFIASAVFNLRTIRDTMDRQSVLAALHLWEARVLSSNGSRIGEWNVSASTDPWEFQFTTNQTTGTDPQFATRNMPITMSFAFKGWGYAGTGSGGTTLVRGRSGQATGSPAGIGNHAAWVANEWAGNLVVIASGTGRNQVARVVSNTTTQLTITTDIRNPATPGYNNAQAWLITPDTTSYYRIGNGRTIDMTAQWTNSMRRVETMTRRILFPAN